MEPVKFMNHLRLITTQRINELKKEELKQREKIALNGNVSFHKRYKEDLRCIEEAKQLNEEIYNELMRA
jgi:hypothetical protein